MTGDPTDPSSDRPDCGNDGRYRHLFRAMDVSFWELDLAGLDAIVHEVRQHAASDIRALIAAHPQWVAEALDVVRVMDVNDKTVRLFGARHREDMFGPIRRFWPSASRNAFAEAMITGLARLAEGVEGAHHVASYTAETRLLTLDGQELDVRFTVCWPHNPNGRRTVLVSMLDVTANKLAEKERLHREADLSHSARESMLRELTSLIDRDVTPPLSAISTHAQSSLRWIDRPNPDLNEASHLLNRIVSDAHRATDVMARIRKLSLGRAPDRIVVLLQEIIHESTHFLHHEMQNQQVQLRLDLRPDLPPIEADRLQMQQVIVNLSMNAMQAMAEQGDGDHHLALCAHSLGDLIQVEVEDNGPGVAPEHMEQLFKGFFTTRQRGLGMGLAICRSIIEAHEGTIWFEPVPGRGSRFCFTLPAA